MTQRATPITIAQAYVLDQLAREYDAARQQVVTAKRIQIMLAPDAIHSRHSGAVHAATLLLEIDLVGGGVAAVDAGSPHCLIARGSAIEQVPLEQQLPLGMFGEAHYEIQRFQLEPGDRMLVVSDGLPGGVNYGGDPAIQATREAVESVRRQGIDVRGVALADYGHDRIYGTRNLVHFTDLSTFVADMRKLVTALVRQVTERG